MLMRKSSRAPFHFCKDFVPMKSFTFTSAVASILFGVCLFVGGCNESKLNDPKMNVSKEAMSKPMMTDTMKSDGKISDGIACRRRGRPG